jgi:endonuclease/exonuclease/phosphatase family metal-dependent hydrolase
MHRVASIAFLALLPLGFASVLFAAEFHIAFWNVENLFDLEDDPAVEYDEDFTPNSPKRWTAERFEKKLNNLASIISKMNDGRGPDVLGLCEVENRKVVELLVEKLASLGREYEIVHKDSPSDRGIDCALVYDANTFALGDSKFHFVDAEKTRDVIEARLTHNSADLFVFVNHWPSRNNDEWQRVKAASVLRSRLDEIFAADANADVVLIGDFNDEPDNVSIKDHLRAAQSQDNLPVGALYDTTAPIRADQKGTFVWDNKWILIDHVIVSPGLLDQSGYRWKPNSSERLEYRELFFHPNFPGAIPRPNKSYSEDRFHKNGYSDHLPVTCIITN